MLDRRLDELLRSTNLLLGLGIRSLEATDREPDPALRGSAANEGLVSSR